jgi:diguanylate cyclase (GGDEF)-like protein
MAHSQPARAVDPEPDAELALASRAELAERAYQLVSDITDGRQVPTRVAREIIDEGTHRGWPEVVTAGMYLEIATTRGQSRSVHMASIERLLARAESLGDALHVALALGRRAFVLTSLADPEASLAGGKDLARAAVLLETAPGSPELRARAHVVCSAAYAQRNLFELVEESYENAGEVLGGEDVHPGLWRAIVYNRAEVQINWACALRELGEAAVLGERANIAIRALAATEAVEMPDAWRHELRCFATLLGAIEPAVGGPDPQTVPAEGEFEGFVHLARALAADDNCQAAAEAETAIATIDQRFSPTVHNLSLCVAAEIDAARAGEETPGLRYGRKLARMRWAARLSELASMQSLLSAERLRTEHEILSQHAYLDDLTRLGNRRALLAYVEGLIAQDVRSVTLVLVDLDRFKPINDTYGHAVGDETLLRVADVLRTGVRTGDIAVRLGGDEFLLVISSIGTLAARRRAKQILAAIAELPWGEVSPGLLVTASLGLATGSPREIEQLKAQADAALYRAKASGGNRLFES